MVEAGLVESLSLLDSEEILREIWAIRLGSDGSALATILLSAWAAWIVVWLGPAKVGWLTLMVEVAEAGFAEAGFTAAAALAAGSAWLADLNPAIPWKSNKSLREIMDKELLDTRNRCRQWQSSSIVVNKAKKKSTEETNTHLQWKQIGSVMYLLLLLYWFWTKKGEI